MHLPSELPTPSNSEQLFPRQEKEKNVINMKKQQHPDDLVLLSPSNSYSMSSVRSEGSSSSSSSTSSSQIPGLNNASTPEELAALLKKTYTTLRSKEKDLKLAAEVGRSLLENNLELKAKHDSLLQQQRQRHQQIRHARQNGNKSPELIMMPSTSILTRSKDTHENASRWLQRVDSPGGLSDTSNNSNTMRLIPKQQAHDAIVHMLTEKNKIMEASLNSTLADLNASKNAGNEQVQKLQDEMNWLQHQLDNAAHTIETIEQQRREQQHHKLTHSMAGTSDAELIAQIEELEAENQRLLAAKSTTQSKLDETTQSLNLWQQQVHDCETMATRYKEQQTACQQQANEISRLTVAVEEYRSQLLHYRDDSMMAQDAPDHVDEKVLVQTPNEHDDIRFSHHHQLQLLRAPPTMVPSQSTQTDLLSELERAWTKELGQTATTSSSTHILGCTNDELNSNRAQTLQKQQNSTPLSVNTNDDNLSFTQEYVPLVPNDIRNAWAKELDAVHPLMTRMPSTKHYSSIDNDENKSMTTVGEEEGAEFYPPIPTAAASYNPPLLSPGASSSSSSSSVASPILQSRVPSSYAPSFRPPSVKRCYAGAESIYAQLSTSGGARTGRGGRAFMAAAYHSNKRRLYHHHHPYQQSSFFVMLIQKIWGWYRFSLILFLAVLINLWQGPDAILEK
ncbi:hypothetical protein BDA99DRAFT_509520 [Phascolomyces articulosus]|uniref:Uncharacterized protein n=1 Tax=Phascolomyces articulosus TaxID=60185 RepID=A0AAD5K0A2_9FUNG|nr:hypothetical protein BDA99DRAFT_509520 [Phascolomyces articulosus]